MFLESAPRITPNEKAYINANCIQSYGKHTPQLRVPWVKCQQSDRSHHQWTRFHPLIHPLNLYFSQFTPLTVVCCPPRLYPTVSCSITVMVCMIMTDNAVGRTMLSWLIEGLWCKCCSQQANQMWPSLHTNTFLRTNKAWHHVVNIHFMWK